MAEAPKGGGRRRRRRMFLLAGLAVAAALGAWLVWGLEPALESWIEKRLAVMVRSQVGCEAGQSGLTLDLAGGWLTLQDLSIDCGERGHLQVGEAVADFDILPLLVGRLHLSDLAVSDPVLRWDGSLPEEQGEAGEPQAGGSGGLSIGRFSLSGGSMQLSLPGEVAHLQVEDLHLSSPDLWDGERLQLDVALGDGNLRSPLGDLEEFNLLAALGWEGQRLSLAGLRLQAAAGGSLSGDGSLHLDADTPPGIYAFTGKATLPTRILLGLGLVPEGVILPETLAWRGSVEGVGTEWDLSGDLDAGTVSAFGLHFDNVVIPAASFSPSGPLNLDLEAQVLDGDLQAGLEGLLTPQGWTLGGGVTLEGVALGGLPASWPWSPFLPRPASRLMARVDGHLPMDRPLGAEADLRLQLTRPPRQPPAGYVAPVGDFHLALKDGAIALAQGQLDLDELSAEASGLVNLDGPLDLATSLFTSDLGATVARFLDPEKGLPVDLGGSAQVAGRLGGNWQRPRLDAGVTGQDLAVGAVPLGLLQAHLVWGEEGLRVEEAVLQGPLGELQGGGLWPGAEDRESFDLQVAVSRLDLGVLAASLGLPLDVSGVMLGSSRASLSAAGVTAQVDLQGEDLVIAGRPVDSASVQAGYGRGGLTVRQVLIQRGDGRLVAGGRIPHEVSSGSDDGADAIELELENYALADLLPGLEASGRLAARGQLKMDLDNLLPQGHLQVEMQQPGWRQWSLPALAAELIADEKRVTARLRGEDPALSLDGYLERTGNHGWTVRGEMGALRVAVPGPVPEQWAGAAGAVLTAEGQLNDLLGTRGRLEIQGLKLDTPAGPLTTQAPVTIVASGMNLELLPLTVQFAQEEIAILGQAMLGATPRYAIQAIGLSDLRNWQALAGDKVDLAGTAVLEVRLQGEGTDAQLFGELAIRSGYLRMADLYPGALEQVEADIRLSGDKVILQSLSGRIGGGRLTADGEIALDGWQPGAFLINLHGERIASRYPPSIRSIVDVELVASGTVGDALLSGRVDILRARYEDDFEIEKRLMSRSVPSLPPLPGPLDNVRLDVDVDAPGQLWIDNDFARAEFLADLHLGGTAARPITQGRVDLYTGGRLTFRDVDYDIDEAALTFSPTFRNDPQMNILARTQVSTYTVNLQVRGRVSDPVLELSSDPALAQDEIVMLLLTGGVWDDSHATQAAPLALTGYLGGALLTSTAIQKITGIDQARIDPVFVEGQGDPTARLTLTERISDRLTASWSTTLTEAQGTTASLRYRVLPRMELRTAQEETGATVIEGRYVRSYPSRKQRKARAEAKALPAAEVPLRQGPAMSLGPVQVIGAPDPPGVEAVTQALGLVQGTPLNSGDLLRGAAGARAMLLGAHYRTARVDCEATTVSADGSTPVQCIVKAGPIIELEVTGQRRKGDLHELRDSIAEEWLEVIDLDNLPGAAADGAARWYRKRGHAHATATARMTEVEEGLLLVDLDIDPGPRVRVSSVVLEGTEALDEKMIRTHLATTGRVVVRRVLLTQRILDQDRENLARLFAGSGFLDVRVAPPVVEYPHEDEAQVTFVVDAGPQRAVDQILFTGVAGVDQQKLEEIYFPLMGSPPDPGILEEMALEVQSLYDAAGYADAAVTWRLERGQQGAVVGIDVREGPQIRIRNVVIEGLGATEEVVVRREIDLQPGALMRHRDLLANQERVRDLDIFRSVVVRGREVPGEEGLRDVVVKLSERNNLALAGGLGFDNEDGIRASFSIGNRNFLGKGGTISFQARLSGGIISGDLRNGWRRVGGSRNNLLGSFSISRQNRQGFSQESEILVGQLARPINLKTTMQVRYRIERFRLFDIETFQPSATPSSLEDAFLDEGRLGSVGLSFVRKTFDVPTLPSNGALRTIDLSVYSTALGSQFDYVLLFFRQGKVWSFDDKRLAYLLGGSLGFMWPYGDTPIVPLAVRFFAGGIASVRGYSQDRLGPANPNTGWPVGGQAVFILNNELRINITRNFAARVFVDVGNVFLEASDLDFGDLKYTAGPGLSYATPAGPLRMYYGFKLNPGPQEDSGRFHLTFGAVF